MEIKIDTKEKFRVLTPQTEHFTDKIAQEVQEILQSNDGAKPENTVLNFAQIQSAETSSLEILKEWFLYFFEANVSFVICCLQPAVKQQLIELDMYDSLNITPTESEAWDIVQMEEMEREMFDEEE